MSDPITIAAATTALLSPYFVAASKKFAEKAGEDAYAGAKKVMGWFRSHLLHDKEGALKKALERAQADPTNSDKEAALKVTIQEFLEANPSLQEELNSMTAKGQTVIQTANTHGDHNTSVQIVGNNAPVNTP